MVGQIEQVTHVIERVMKLGPAQWPMPPIRARFTAGQADPQHLPDQIHERERVVQTAQPGGDLDVEYALRERPVRSWQIRRSSPAACITIRTDGSRTRSQNGVRSPMAR